MDILELIELAETENKSIRIRHELWDRLGIDDSVFFIAESDGKITIPNKDAEKMLAADVGPESPHWYEVKE